MARANSIMRPTEATTAAIMTDDLVDQADRGDDGIEREHHVDDDDLQDDGGEARLHALRGMAFLTFGELVDFHGRLPHQEQAARDEDEIPAGDLRAGDREQRRGEAHDPRQHQQQPDAHEHGEEQADAARVLALLALELVDQDRDENDVVDAEHQLERRQREKRDPNLRIGQEGNDGFHEWRDSTKGDMAAKIVRVP